MFRNGTLRPLRGGISITLHTCLRYINGNLQIIRSLSTEPAVDKVKAILGNGRHSCPGCGTAFHFDDMRASKGGYICWSLIGSRIQFLPNAPSGAPTFMLFADSESKKTHGNKFTRLTDWENRTYTRIELQRINKRLALPQGTANALLQQHLATDSCRDSGARVDEVLNHVIISSENTDMSIFNNDPFFRAEDDSKTLLDASEPTFNSSCTHDHNSDTRIIKLLKKSEKFEPLRCSRCRELSGNSQLRQTRFVPALPVNTATNFSAISERDRAAIAAHLDENTLVIAALDMINLPASIPNFLHFDELLASVGYNGPKPAVLFVGTKMDLLPHEYSRVQLLKKYLHQMCIKHVPKSWLTNIVDFIPMSAHTGDGVNVLRTAVLDWVHSRKGNVFLFGNVNSGKSKIYNTLLNRNTFTTKSAAATVSSRAGTTLGVLHAPVDSIRTVKSLPSVNGRLRLFDLPGIFAPENALILHPDAPLSDKEASMIVIRTRFKARRHVLIPGESGYFAALLRVDCAQSVQSSIPVKLCIRMYVRDDVPFMRFKSKLISDTLTSHLSFDGARNVKDDSDVRLAPPIFAGPDDDRLKIFMDLKAAHSVTITANSTPHEVAFSDGVGWALLSIVPLSGNAKLSGNESLNVNFYTPSGTGVSERMPLYDFQK